jgi:hypothetical protein
VPAIISTTFNITTLNPKKVIEYASLYDKGISVMHDNDGNIICLQFIDNRIMFAFHYSIGFDYVKFNDTILVLKPYKDKDRNFRSRFYDSFQEALGDNNSILNLKDVSKIYMYKL